MMLRYFDAFVLEEALNIEGLRTRVHFKQKQKTWSVHFIENIVFLFQFGNDVGSGIS